MAKRLSKWIAACLLLLPLGGWAMGQTTVSGSVVDEDGNPLVGVNVLVEGTVTGTTTDFDGNFTLRTQRPSPLTLKFSAIGYATQKIEVSDGDELEVKMAENVSVLGQEVVVSASRHEESILESPVSIERMGIAEVRNAPSDNYYQSLAGLKGVDVSSSSIGFQIVNSRGFNSTGNTRFVQLIDGMDSQAPGLNFPVGSLNGPNDLDVESLEFIPGAASALYGPNAFNGILLMTSKNPFDYQGLSVKLKGGVNHVDGEDADPSPVFETAFRYAKSIDDKFAFKITGSYFRANDWRNNFDQDQNPTPEGMSFNPGANIINEFGDEVSTNLALLRGNESIIGSLEQSFAPGIEASLIAAGVPADQAAAQAAAQAEQLAPVYAGLLPEHVVSRTPYAEEQLVDYNSYNAKLGGSLHYRFSDDAEVSYQYNGGFGTSVYTGSNRYSLNNFDIQQHKVELEGGNYGLRAYATIENSADSYDAVFSGIGANSAALDNSTWFGTYAGTYAGAIFQQVATAAGEAGDPSLVGDPTFINQVLGALPADDLHNAARGAADGAGRGRIEPGTELFGVVTDSVQSIPVPFGAQFDDQTYLWHIGGEYDFSKHIEFFDELQVGGSYRNYVLRSNGTIFADDDGDITIYEYGAFLQVGKRLFEEKLRLTASLRYDKNENFDGQFNPRLSAVFQPKDGHNFRASYQTGFRMPTTQGQHIDLFVGSYRLLGGLDQYAEEYRINHDPANSRYAYRIEAVNQLTQDAINGTTDPTVLAGSEYVHQEVKPEQVQSFEIGYKGLIDNSLLIDVAFYHNTYTDFIFQQRLRVTNFNPFDPATGEAAIGELVGGSFIEPTPEEAGANNTYQTYTNFDEELVAQGFVAGLQYAFSNGYTIGTNYNWNELTSDLESGQQSQFNTPEHKVNFTFGNQEVIDNLGFSVAYRWQDSFLWEGAYATGEVDAFSYVDAQVSYKFDKLNTILKVGGSNVFNQRYEQNYGGPTIGALYYVSLTYDQFMN